MENISKSALNYRFYKKRGICTLCHKERAMFNHTRCPDCAEKDAIRRKLRYEAIKKNSDLYSAYLKQTAEGHRKLRQQRREIGACVDCGKRSAHKGYVRCIDCLLKRRRKKDCRYNNDIPRSERTSYGLCYICGEPVLEGRKVCAKHYNSTPEGFAAGRENVFWRELNSLIFKNKKGGSR